MQKRAPVMQREAKAVWMMEIRQVKLVAVERRNR